MLEQEKALNKAGQLAERLLRLDLVILDELGYLPFSASGGALLFHLLSKLYERTSIIITRSYACGSRSLNVVPAPGVDCTSISPSCIWTVRYTMDSPIPLPLTFVVKYRSKIRCKCSGGMPTPVSLNAIDTRCPRADSHAICSVPPFGIA